MRRQSVGRRLPSAVARLRTAATTAIALAVAGTLALAPATAQAVVPTVQPRTAAVVTADALPTVQINGVVWTQVMIGNIVYAGGEFTAARPAGAPEGSYETPRGNLLAYDVTTGKLVTSFVPPVFYGAVRALAASPDQKTLYVGGDFTQAGSTPRSHFAAVDAATGALTSMAPSFNNRVSSFAVTPSTVYVGGSFTKADDKDRARLAALDQASGTLTDWAPAADDSVNALVVTADQRLVVAGGSFTTLVGQPASGSGALDPATGAGRPWKVNQVVRNGGLKSAILSLTADATTVYATGYTFGTGNFEGVYAASATDGTVRWLQDCHGDTYSAVPIGDVVYSVGHAHYCRNIGGFDDTSPRSAWYRGLAVTKAAAGTVAKNGQPGGSYGNFEGQPAPALVNWFPAISAGTYTKMYQGAWSIVGNDTYVALGGEFPSVGGKAQQGLVRMAVPAKAPLKQGPVDTSAAINPQATVNADGSVTLSWLANWDRDDLALSYRVTRGGRIITTKQSAAPFWNRPTMTYRDTRAGSLGSPTATYAVVVSDPAGNTVTSGTVTVTVPATKVKPLPTVTPVPPAGRGSTAPKPTAAPKPTTAAQAGQGQADQGSGPAAAQGRSAADVTPSSTPTTTSSFPTGAGSSSPDPGSPSPENSTPSG